MAIAAERDRVYEAVVRRVATEYADHLRCSIRWLEYRLTDGLPSDLIAGKRTFRPSVADEWLRREGHIR